MPRVVVIYDSESGNTARMAQMVAQGVEAAGVDCEAKAVADAGLDDLLNADGVVLGSPNYYGSMSGNMKSFIDRSVKVRKRMENKVGAAFCSAGVVGGGGETVIVGLIQAMLINGMIVVGDPLDANGHYGPVAIGTPDDRVSDTCHKLGRRVGELVKRLAQ